MQRKTIWLSLWSINTHKEIYLMVSSLNNPFMCVNRRKLFSVSILGWFTTHISVPQVRYNGNLELLTLYLLFYTSRISHHKLCVILRLNWLLNWNKCPWLCCGSLFRSATIKTRKLLRIYLSPLTKGMIKKSIKGFMIESALFPSNEVDNKRYRIQWNTSSGKPETWPIWFEGMLSEGDL